MAAQSPGSLRMVALLPWWFHTGQQSRTGHPDPEQAFPADVGRAANADADLAIAFAGDTRSSRCVVERQRGVGAQARARPSGRRHWFERCDRGEAVEAFVAQRAMVSFGLGRAAAVCCNDVSGTREGSLSERWHLHD